MNAITEPTSPGQNPGLSFETQDGRTWNFYRIVPGNGKVVFGKAARSPEGAVMVTLDNKDVFGSSPMFPSSFFDKLDQGLGIIRGEIGEKAYREGAETYFNIYGVRYQ